MRRFVATATLGLLSFALFVPASALAQGNVHRLAADFDTWGDPTEIFTANLSQPNGQGGAVIYRRNIVVPRFDNTLFFTFAGTGDTHGGARLQMAVNLDGVPFNAGGNPVGKSPSGWLTLQRHQDYASNYQGDGGGGPGDLHDNSIHMTWCTKVTPGRHTVELRLGAQPDPVTGEVDIVFVEGNHYLIDSARLSPHHNCAEVDAPDGGGASAVRPGTPQPAE